MTGVQSFKVQVSDRAIGKVMDLLDLSQTPQWVELRLSQHVGIDFGELPTTATHNLPDNFKEIANTVRRTTPSDNVILLVDIKDKGIVVSSDFDTLEYEGGSPLDEPNPHAYRPLFVPWQHVYGICAYRDT